MAGGSLTLMSLSGIAMPDTKVATLYPDDKVTMKGTRAINALFWCSKEKAV